jgi:hypothetical protein
MELERLLAVTVMSALGIATLIVGWLGRRQRLDYSLGGWTRQTASPESWADAHARIGAGFMVAGAIAILGGLVAVSVPTGGIGPVVVTGSIVMLVPVVTGIVVGTNRLQQR